MTSPSAGTPKKLTFVDPARFTPQFHWKVSGDRRTEAVFCEGVSLPDVAAKIGTPAYLYSHAAIMDSYDELHHGLGKLPHTLCFAVKANGNLTILSQLAKRGSGFDVVSGGELEQLRHIGVPGDRIVFSGVGKSREEIREALQYQASRKSKESGILLFNIESAEELESFLEESSRPGAGGGRRPSLSIRVNPDVQAGGHPHIATGHHEHKFGLDWSAARDLYLAHRSSKWIAWQGISAHIGSQIVSLAPFRRAVTRLAGYVAELKSSGIALRYLDIGGGLGVRYTNEQPASRTAYARMAAKIVKPLGLHLLLEPGRTIIAQAGVLLTRVVYAKTNRGKSFVIVDAGMNDLMRPALYGAVHPITRVTRAAGKARTAAQRVDIVGPVCETGDCFLKNWPLGEVETNDVLAIWVTGAYGMSLASNYNARRRAAEVLVEGNRFRIIRSRETHKDLLHGDILA
ncbi:MAG TPA: diaminopimelate decarboxylase [Candidatus Saccharimonadales bacterium]|nr:diaminopimelate decarboxylase [Candidatus Saccharimonadales bacterium]